MSHALVNKVKPLTGLTFAEKSILFQLADLSSNGEIIFFRMSTLTLYAGCSYSTAQRTLRRLERLGKIIPLEEKRGRSSMLGYRFDVCAPPVVQPPVTEPLPTNGKKPLTVHDPLPPETPERAAEIKALLAAKKAELLAKKREEKHERPGRAAREGRK